MLCVPTTLQKHGGFFSPSVTNLHIVLQILVAPTKKGCGKARAQLARGQEDRHWNCLCLRRGRSRLSLKCTCHLPQLQGSECHFFHTGITLLKPNVPYSCFHRQLCVMLKFSGWHKVWICSTLSSLPANLRLFSVSAGIVDMHNYTFHHSWIFYTNPHFTALLCSQKWEIMFLLV